MQCSQKGSKSCKILLRRSFLFVSHSWPSLNVLGYQSQLLYNTIAMWQYCHCEHEGSSHLSPVLALCFFLSRCKFSTLTTRQPMVEFDFYLLTFSRSPLRKPEYKSLFLQESNSRLPYSSTCTWLPSRPLGRRGYSSIYNNLLRL